MGGGVAAAHGTQAACPPSLGVGALMFRRGWISPWRAGERPPPAIVPLQDGSNTSPSQHWGACSSPDEAV